MNEKINATYRLVDNILSHDEFAYHSHDKFEIYYFHGGNCKYVIGNNIYDLQEDDIIIMNGLTLHRAYPEIGENYERSVVEFSSEWLNPILANLNVPELLNPFNQLSYSLFRGTEKSVLTEIKELIKKIAQTDMNAVLGSANKLESRLQNGEISAVLIQLLFKIYELSKKKLVIIPSVESEKSTHVKRIKVWIDQNYSHSITLDNIADNLNISKYYMSRIFKDVTGYTIMQYLMNCRINHAKYLLEIHPQKSILEVALKSGFEDSSHFSRYFRKQMKITPTEYRNSRAIRFPSTNSK